MKKIFLDPGHGSTDVGATFRGVFEKDLCLQIAFATAYHMCREHEVFMTRYTDQYIGITRRCEMANEKKADLFISIHCNADPDPDLPGMHEAKGEEIWICPGSKRGRALATAIGKHLDVVMPEEPWRGVKEDDLGVVVMTDMPACLIETAFIDNSESQRRLKDLNTQLAIAAAIAAGVRDYFVITL
jgi:N-acetylmuramoyl-L-alanine amidase